MKRQSKNQKSSEKREKRYAEIDKRFQALKRRTEIRERYGVFTQKMFEDLLEELRGRIREDLTAGLQSTNQKLDWLIGEYKKFDEEHILLVGRVSHHDDRIDKLEKKVGISVQ